ncbi:MAG: hypothetical protein M3405_12640 [Acidobacteriota bacterium]|jgi:hypothetical protein|nr:hypothetical protein [Acidobacteriota bacterium]
MKKNENSEKNNKDSKILKIKIDESLNKYQGKIIFKETLKKANETLKNVKLPENLNEKTKSV